MTKPRTHTHTHTGCHPAHAPASVRSDVLRRTQTYSDVLYILLPSSGTPASVRSDGRQPSFPSVCRPSRRAGCFLPSCDAPAFTGISVERAKRVKSEGPGISVEREKRVKSEVRLACGWPAAVKHARKAPQNPVRPRRACAPVYHGFKDVVKPTSGGAPSGKQASKT